MEFTVRALKALSLALVAALLAASGSTAAVAQGGTAMTMQFTQQQSTATAVDNIELLVTSGSVIGNGVSYDSGLVDVRAFNSFILYADAFQLTALATDNWQVSIRFYADSAGTDLV